jgi:hypothetical protein
VAGAAAGAVVVLASTPWIVLQIVTSPHADVPGLPAPRIAPGTVPSDPDWLPGEPPALVPGPFPFPFPLPFPFPFPFPFPLPGGVPSSSPPSPGGVVQPV